MCCCAGRRTGEALGYAVRGQGEGQSSCMSLAHGSATKTPRTKAPQAHSSTTRNHPLIPSNNGTAFAHTGISPHAHGAVQPTGQPGVLGTVIHCIVVSPLASPAPNPIPAPPALEVYLPLLRVFPLLATPAPPCSNLQQPPLTPWSIWPKAPAPFPCSASAVPATLLQPAPPSVLHPCPLVATCSSSRCRCCSARGAGARRTWSALLRCAGRSMRRAWRWRRPR